MDGVQCRMARGALNWTTRHLAVIAGVNLSAVNKLQAGHGIAPADQRRIRDAFEGAGMVFLDADHAVPIGPGVRLKTP